MNQDLISIILPVYNVKPYLEECLNSIINQTYKNIELIIVNDGSIDESDFICERYKELDSRIKVIHDNENHGLSYARNKGLDMCSGKYINFIDSDDYVSLDFIEKLYESIISNEADISMCGYSTFSSNKIIESKKILEYSTICKGKDLLKDNGVNTVAWNKLYKADIWKDIRFDEGKLHEDLFIMYKIMYGERKVSVVKENLYFHRLRDDSITGKILNSVRSKDIVEASENRLNFFKYKEQDYYFMSLVELIDKLRREYSSIYVYGGKREYKKELGVMIKRARECYKEYIFHNRSKYKCGVKITLFIFFPNTFSRLKKFKYNLKKGISHES